MNKESYLTWLSKGGLFPPSMAIGVATSLAIQDEFLFEMSDSLNLRELVPGVVDEISIKNFKSVQEARVQLKPLTVIVGRNSSGKSSLIQSLLLSVQHLTNRYSSDRKISLNQHLVRLGTFSQLHRHGAESPLTTVGIECRGGVGWSVDLSTDDSSDKSRNADLAVTRGHYNGHRTKFSFELSEVRRPVVTFPAVLPGDTPAQKHEIFAAQYSLRVVRAPDSSLENISEATFPYVLLRDAASEQTAPIPLEEMDLLRVCSELLFSHASQTQSSSVKVKIKGKDVIVTKRVGGKSELWKVLEALLARILSEFDKSKIESCIESINALNELDDDSFEVFADFVHTLTFGFSIDDVLHKVSSDLHRNLEHVKRYIASSSVAEIRQILSELWTADHFKVESPTVLVPITISGRFGDLDTINFDLISFRKQLAYRLRNVYHVGPIRDPESPADPISDPLYVGSKGEHTVEVLQREAARRVLDPLTGKTMLFSKALAAALKNLELADGAQIEDRGRERPGISMTPFHEKNDSSTSDDLSTELNAVGVGVSQVLPVVMQCLLAQPGGSLVIVEQPELHLHPRLEQTLADFFLACVRSGRQILIETHSEHLVNRLRLRIAEDMSDEVASLVKVVFAEQRDGVTTYREPGIDQYGNTEFGDAEQDWPEGFLDLTLDEARRLLKAANERKITEIEKKRAEIESQARNRQQRAHDDESLEDDEDEDF